MSELRPSIPRTYTQAVLRVVSIVMAILGGLILLAGGLVFADSALAGMDELWSSITYVAIILAAAVLIIATAVLGLRASDDASRVGPYRFLCYLVSLVVLVAVVWGWGMGTFLLFNPIVLMTTVVYVLLCTHLADRVQKEHDEGVTGETFFRTRYQRMLHLFSDLLVVSGVMSCLLTGMALIVLLIAGDGAEATLSGVTIEVDDSLVGATMSTIAAGLTIVAGCLGIYGSNRPRRVMPFLVFAGVTTIYNVVQIAMGLASNGLQSLPAAGDVFDLVFMGACLYLAVRVRMQTRAELSADPAPGAAA